MKKLNMKHLYAFIIIIFIEVFIAVFIHDSFIRPYIGDVLVVVAIYCFLRIFILPYKLLPLYIFLFSASVEILQYFDIVSILNISNKFLSVLIGAVFDFKDIICYFTGCFLLMIWQKFNRINYID